MSAQPPFQGLLPGNTAFVVGTPERDIGRLAYLNCRYGIPAVSSGAPVTPGIEIGISLYGSERRSILVMTAHPEVLAQQLRDTVTEYDRVAIEHHVRNGSARWQRGRSIHGRRRFRVI